MRDDDFELPMFYSTMTVLAVYLSFVGGFSEVPPEEGVQPTHSRSREGFSRGFRAWGASKYKDQ